MVVKFLLILLSGATLCTALITSIIEPCETTDYKCIGDNLAANSRCKQKTKRFLPHVYKVDSFHFDTPYFNSSYIDRNLIVKNQHKCVVTRFFFNTKTERTVLSIDCPNLYLESDRTYIQHKTYEEDQYYYYHIKAVYPKLVTPTRNGYARCFSAQMTTRLGELTMDDVIEIMKRLEPLRNQKPGTRITLIRITINFPPHFDLCSASVFTDVVELPKLSIDPQNKPTRKALTTDLSALNIYERENCHARGKSLAYTFVDSLLCKYDCPLPK